eukprot:7486645-Heterocapsa_arctica.AAC.1
MSSKRCVSGFEDPGRSSSMSFPAPLTVSPNRSQDTRFSSANLTERVLAAYLSSEVLLPGV